MELGRVVLCNRSDGLLQTVKRTIGPVMRLCPAPEQELPQLRPAHPRQHGVPTLRLRSLLRGKPINDAEGHAGPVLPGFRLDQLFVGGDHRVAL